MECGARLLEAKMKKLSRIVISFVLLGSVTITLAVPDETFLCTPPTNYENGQTIPVSDALSFRLYCGTSSGGPYPDSESFICEPAGSVKDVAFVVKDTPGTYYCVSTAVSSAHNLESAVSNERNFTVTSVDLGFVPRPPILQ